MNDLYAYERSMSVIEKTSAKYKRTSKNAQYIRNPGLWVRERLGLHLWSLQRIIMASVLSNKKTIVKSCHDSGKTFLAAIIVCWWIDTHPPDQTMVVSTAPTAYQVNKLLWEYIRTLHRVHNLSGTVSEASEWKGEDRQVVGMGRKPADTNIHGFHGVHRKYVLVIIDEACGVTEQIWTGVEAITTNPDNRILAIGNPDDPATEFGRIFRDKDPSWTPFTISAFDTPNFTEEWKELPAELAPLLMEVAWVEEKKTSWGETSSRYLSKVLAEFPESSSDTFFSPVTVQLGLTNTAELQKQGMHDKYPVLGVDVARFGKDQTSVVMNDNGICTVAGLWDKCDTYASAEKVHNIAVAKGCKEVRVDASGLGVGVIDVLRRLCAEYYVVIEMVGNAASPDLNRWRNYRAYIHDVLRDGLVRGEIGLPAWTHKRTPAQRLCEELEGLRYKFVNGAVLMESKDEMMRRKIKSPDISDALTYACAPIDINDPNLGLVPGEVDIVDANDMDAMYVSLGFVIAPC